MAVVWPSPMSQPLIDYDMPIVDHIHARHRGIHWPFSTYKPEQEIFYPDVDVRDYETGYAIDMELPGLLDKNSIKVEWTSKHDIMISGILARPELPVVAKSADANGRRNEDISVATESSEKDKSAPILLVAERRTEVDAANLRAKLENGLLEIRVDKVKTDQRTSGQAKIE
ncbi:hypothetical protein E4T42_09147 [Aureobasidium subglaciale]|nr:hypothetical protein E4T38_03808 [Aureobasidium subglaciale]KAI5217561.1 hypothetical protein E4T41_08831 [Aureobasidium subglaciale]KAI5225366.1 hypothetical protein E4T40_03583 [Aureobasidium subglaciale]KAI5237808.1 hypothetical protein E4T42_09147 [Aureobasidium subglaciale]KAI5255080.1 hypothetical protein E4T46_08865 [Aureobasidium subglaciale]